MSQPGLFGLVNANRDFTQADAWGKNQFNASFPAALICYMASKKIRPVYLQLDTHLQVKQGFIEVEQLLGSYIQTFPKDFTLLGTKTNLEQMIGNAVPVLLAKAVGEKLMSYASGQKEFYKATQEALFI